MRHLWITDIDSVTNLVRSSGRRVVTIDGFSGVGKSTLARMLANTLRWTHVELDRLIGDNERPYVSYPQHLELNRLLLDGTEPCILDGIIVDDVFELTRLPPPPFRLYIKRVQQAAWGELTWLDQPRTLSVRGRGIVAEVELYHMTRRPHEKADMVVLRRIEDSPASS